MAPGDELMDIAGASTEVALEAPQTHPGLVIILFFILQNYRVVNYFESSKHTSENLEMLLFSMENGKKRRKLPEK